MFALTIAAKSVGWLRLVSTILSPPPITNQVEIVSSFAEEARTKAQKYVSGHIASKTRMLAKQMLSSRVWNEKIPEQNLWEGTALSGYSKVGGSASPVQPTRIPARLLQEVTSRLNSLGVELLTKEFVLGTMKECRESIATAYDDIGEDISSEAALQLLADILVLEIALSSPEDGEFNSVKQRLIHRV